MATLSFKPFEAPLFRFAPASYLRMCAHVFALGSFSSKDGNGNENVTSK